MTPLDPNPHSPYATATPSTRHIFASPTFFPAPLPGVLAVTACERTAVVPEANLTEARPDADDLPEGLCPLCVAVMNGGDVPEHPLTTCRECEARTHHDGLCAVCRQEAHEEWWPTRDEKPAAERPAVCDCCLTPFDPADTRPDGRSRYGGGPYCRRCVDRCHDTESADHRCVICA